MYIDERHLNVVFIRRAGPRADVVPRGLVVCLDARVRCAGSGCGCRVHVHTCAMTFLGSLYACLCGRRLPLWSADTQYWMDMSFYSSPGFTTTHRIRAPIAPTTPTAYALTHGHTRVHTHPRHVNCPRILAASGACSTSPRASSCTT